MQDIGRSIEEAAPVALIEDKRYALSIHFRQAPHLESAIAVTLEHWRERLSQAGLTLLPGKSVIDIEPATASKGTALRNLMVVPPFAERTPIFAGDDLTDREVLAVLPEFGGIGISVARAMPGAAFQFSTPATLRAWLAEQLGFFSKRIDFN